MCACVCVCPCLVLKVGGEERLSDQRKRQSDRLTAVLVRQPPFKKLEDFYRRRTKSHRPR